MVIPITFAKAPALNTDHTPSWRNAYVFQVSTIEIELPKLNLNPKNFNPCSCVSYAKAVLGGRGGYWGDAINIEPNTIDPGIGDLLLTREGRGHVAVILGFDKDNLVVTEANYLPCKASQRIVQRNSPLIRGFRSLSTTN